MNQRLIAGIPEQEVNELHAKVREMKVQGFDLAFGLARMSPDDRKNTGYESADQALLHTARDIEKLVQRLERKYPA